MKYLTNSGLSYFLNKIKAYLTSSTYLNSIGISNSEIDDIADDAGYSSGSLPASEDIFITGDIIPNTDNSVDLGASSKNIKMVYTKGITINGTQFLPSDYIPRSGLSTVATSGSYNDLSNKPTIPTKTSDLTNDSGFLTSHQDLSGYVPRSGGAVITGETLGRNVDDNNLRILGGSAWNTGAQLQLCGKNMSGGFGGTFTLYATLDEYNISVLQGTPSGTLTWNTKNIAMQEDVVPRSGGAVLSGYEYSRTVDDSFLYLSGGATHDNGATIELYGKDFSVLGGWFVIRPQDSNGFRQMDIHPDGTWTWTGTACQLVSDQRLKQQIAEIDDKLLDAWEDVDLVQFKYNDAVDQKGDKARLHTGYVVQQIDNACQKHGVDISAYGLFCHEEYPEETEEVEVEQADGTKVKETKVIREASEHYSLRYTETLVVECAYLRKQIKELKERLEKLEDK